MKEITLAHYVMKDINASPWEKTWDNLMKFGSRIAPKIAPMGYTIKLRKVIMEDLTEDNLMSANMVTIECADVNVPETPIEDIIMLQLDFSECSECKTPDGQEFPCRTFETFTGEKCQVLPEEFFMEAVLRVAFKAQHTEGDHCHCGEDCSSCASGCGDEEIGKRHDCGRK